MARDFWSKRMMPQRLDTLSSREFSARSPESTPVLETIWRRTRTSRLTASSLPTSLFRGCIKTFSIRTNLMIDAPADFLRKRVFGRFATDLEIHAIRFGEARIVQPFPHTTLVVEHGRKEAVGGLLVQE